jgi:hypothetical protein
MPARREGIEEENQKQIGLRPFLVGDDDGLTSRRSSSAATGITTGEAYQVPHASDSPPAATGYDKNPPSQKKREPQLSITKGENLEKSPLHCRGSTASAGHVR